MNEEFTVKELRMIKDLLEKEVIISFGLNRSVVELHDKVCKMFYDRGKQLNKSDGVAFNGTNR